MPFPDAFPDLPIVPTFSFDDEEDEPRPISPLRAFGAQPSRVFAENGAPVFDRHARFEGKSDTRRRRKLKEISKTLPRSPGVYFFYGTGERLLYIGKAKCLRERVGSYFGETTLRRPPKIRRLLAEIRRIEHQLCGSELEALLVERRLIAERLPILNRQHKRFAVYPYLLLSRENFPRLTVTRAEPVEETKAGKLEVGRKAEIEYSIARFSSLQAQVSSLPLENAPHAGELPGLYLGPFTSPRHAYWTFEAVRTLFPLRSCEGAIVPDAKARGCFYHEIARCLGPCIGATSEDEYAKLCADLVGLLQTGNAPQLDDLRAKMQRLSDEWRFEEAATLKLQLDAIEAVSARLQRLQRMRAQNNVVIIQGAKLEDGDERPKPATEHRVLDINFGAKPASVFLIQGGVVRRHIIVRNWRNDEKTLRRAIADVYDNPPPIADYTAKTELDEMMILDRWLKVNGATDCCIWMNNRTSRQWTSNVLRGVRRWMLHNDVTQRGNT